MSMHATTPGSLPSGTIIDGKYSIESFIGKGGMCAVYRAKHLVLQKDIAIKVLHHALSDSDAVQRFRRESTTLAKLHHPNLVTAYGFGLHDGHPYMAMELIEGKSLADLLVERGKLDSDEFVRIIEQTCNGLAYLHEQGIIHRDIKPSNVMLTNHGTVKIVDFGLAKFSEDTEKPLQKLTRTGAMIGTALYMSPEQCMGTQLDARSDIYSLGCMMFELLDGQPAFFADSSMAVVYKHLEGQYGKSDKLGVFKDLILSCLQPAPDARPASVTALRDYLLRPKSAPALQAVSHVVASDKSKSRRVLIAVLSLCICTVAAVSVLFSFRRVPPPSHKFDEMDANIRGDAVYIAEKRLHQPPEKVQITLREMASRLDAYRVQLENMNWQNHDYRYRQVIALRYLAARASGDRPGETQYANMLASLPAALGVDPPPKGSMLSNYLEAYPRLLITLTHESTNNRDWKAAEHFCLLSRDYLNYQNRISNSRPWKSNIFDRKLSQEDALLGIYDGQNKQPEAERQFRLVDAMAEQYPHRIPDDTAYMRYRAAHPELYKSMHPERAE